MTATREPSVHGSELVRLVGADTEVPLVTGGTRRYVNLDYAASAPALQAVHDAVEELLRWYSSVHRGAGFKSRASTAAYEGARESIRRFVNARDDDAVIITRNTTDSINLLAGTLPEGTHVVAFAGEHHANLLPWKRIGVRYLPVPETPAEMLEQLETTLRDLPHCEDPHLVAATGASNVTGEIWPVAEIARVAHQYGARLLVDAAQLAPHAPIDMQRDGIDYLALSGHKLYAPYGAGALIGERDWLSAGDPVPARRRRGQARDRRGDPVGRAARPPGGRLAERDRCGRPRRRLRHADDGRDGQDRGRGVRRCSTTPASASPASRPSSTTGSGRPSTHASGC